MDSKFNNSGSGTLKVPGFNLPLDAWPDNPKANPYSDTHFEHGIDSARPQRLTVREICMLNFMNLVTDKPDWWNKVLDSSIVARWRDESRADRLLSDAAFDWCVKELKDKANEYAQLQYVRVLDNESVCVKSDTLIPLSLQSQLQAAVKPLLDQHDKDWHPGSNNQVLNLVHPSLYPLVYQRSRVLTTAAAADVDTSFNNVGQGEIVPEPKMATSDSETGGYTYRGEMSASQKWSNRFQWLPCEVKFLGEHGTNVQIASYINNLHPRLNRDLYPVIERLISFSIGPWNEMLYKGYRGRFPPRIYTYGAEIDDVEEPDWSKELYTGINDEDIEPYRERMREYIALPNSSHITAQDQQDIEDRLQQAVSEDDLMELLSDKTRMIRAVHHPEPGVSYTYEQWKEGKDLAPIVHYYDRQMSSDINHKFQTVSLEEDFRQQGLQVIVKLSSIELTPENPAYKGGNWHLEGKLNEHIVATAIYYYDVDNVTESKIWFRQEATLDDYLTYEQDDHDPLSMIFGTESMRDEPAVQEIGSIKTNHGRFIAFPNVCQHRVAPFCLADPTRPGHRRFLVLWLVDPHLRVMSTANVPPQQHSWWTDEALKALGNNKLNKLPAEIMDQILNDDSVDWPMKDEEAKRLRLDLMAERTTFIETLHSSVQTYNLCEH